METAPLNKSHIAVLEAFERGENPAIFPLMRKRLVKLGYIVATEPPRPSRPDGRRKTPAPRRHELTDDGRAFLAAHRAGTGEALQVPVTGYLSGYKRMVTG